jgi:hypothetical protein
MVFLVTEQLVLDRTTLDKNLLSANLKPAIILAQKVQLTTIVGDKLINKIYSDIETSSLTGNYKKLVDDYLTDVVIYATLYHASTNLLSKFTNRGLQQESSENSSHSDISVYRELKSDSKNQMEYFSQRANKWLFKNRNLFPEYTICGSDDGTQQANPNNAFFGGLVL